MTQKSRTIRVSMEVYDQLCKLGKTNDTFTSVVARVFRENNLICTEKKKDGYH